MSWDPRQINTSPEFHQQTYLVAVRLRTEKGNRLRAVEGAVLFKPVLMVHGFQREDIPAKHQHCPVPLLA